MEKPKFINCDNLPVNNVNFEPEGFDEDLEALMQRQEKKNSEVRARNHKFIYGDGADY